MNKQLACPTRTDAFQTALKIKVISINTFVVIQNVCKFRCIINIKQYHVFVSLRI